MKHLTVDEMIDFVSFNKLNNESFALAAKVNAHIFECAACKKKVSAFQIIYDKFVKLGKKDEFGKAIEIKLAENEEKNKKATRDLDNLL